MKKVIISLLIILVAISPLFRGVYYDYEIYAFSAVAALLFVLYLFYKLRKDEAIAVNKWFTLFGILLIAAYALSFIKALNPRENINAMLIYGGYFMMALVFYDYFQDRKQQFMQALMYPVTIAGFICAVMGIEALTNVISVWNVLNKDGRIGSTIQYSNTAAIYFAVCIIFAITLINSVKGVAPKALVSGMGSILILALFLTASRGGVLIGAPLILLTLIIQPKGYKLKGFIYFLCMSLPCLFTQRGLGMGITAKDYILAAKWLLISFAIAGLSCLIFAILFSVSNKKGFKPKAVVYAAGSIVFLAALILSGYLMRERLASLLAALSNSRLMRMNFLEKNFLIRLDLDVYALRMIAENWLLGVGKGGFKVLLFSVQDYFYSTIFAHNNYFQVFVEAGILGFTSYIALVGTSLFQGAYSLLKSKDKLFKIYMAGIYGGFLAFAIHSAIDFDLSFLSMGFLFWVMMAMILPYTAPVKGGEKAAPAVKGQRLVLGNRTVAMTLITIGAILISMNTLYFTATLNANEAEKCIEQSEYKAAIAFYEEALRLDTMNPSFEYKLAKLYNFSFNTSKNPEEKAAWLAKARVAAENSVKLSWHNPDYIDTLVLTYLDSDMPLQAMEKAQKLVIYQKYKGSNYELLARSYLAAAGYYEKNGNISEARELLEKCLEIKDDPYLRKSKLRYPRLLSAMESPYVQSKALSTYMEEASEKLKKLD